MARRRGAGEPLWSMELLMWKRRAQSAPAEAAAWVADRIEDIEAHAAGAPCADDRDGTVHAAELLALVREV